MVDKRVFQIGILALPTVILLLVFQNCGRTGELKSRAEDTSKAAREDLDARHKNLLELAGRDLSCRNVSDCEIVPVGHRGCGGPSSYLVISVRSEVREQILSLADELVQAERELNRDSEAVSTCEYLMPPEIACEQNACKTLDAETSQLAEVN
ncbi:MAG: hypothetical protein AB7G93_05100 [Bdellovibrionales bacterium]